MVSDSNFTTISYLSLRPFVKIDHLAWKEKESTGFKSIELHKYLQDLPQYPFFLSHMRIYPSVFFLLFLDKRVGTSFQRSFVEFHLP